MADADNKTPRRDVDEEQEQEQEQDDQQEHDEEHEEDSQPQQEQEQQEQQPQQAPSPSPPSPSPPSPAPPSHTTSKLSTIQNTSTPFHERLSQTLRYLQQTHDDLKGVHMKDYKHLEELKESLECVRHLGEEFERDYLGMCLEMGSVRRTLEDIQTTVNGKLTNEGLQSWLEGPAAHPADKKRVAEEKSTLAQAARARAAMARTAAELPRAEERAAKLELHVAQAVDDAQVAVLEAEEAAKMAEEARKAAEQKKLAEEEAARKAEIARKKKEEEDMKRREEEEKRKREAERLAGSPEELERRKKEAERRDPNNWTPWTYSVDPGDIDIPVGCVVRCIAGGLGERDALNVERVEQLGGPLVLADNEELVSNIIKIQLSRDDAELNLEEPLAIALPHCAPRVTYREPVVKMLQPSGKWTELPTEFVTLENIKEYKFVQARVPKFPTFTTSTEVLMDVQVPEEGEEGEAQAAEEPLTTRTVSSSSCTLAVVTRVRREIMSVGKKGAKLVPAVDGRICVTFKPGCYNNQTHVTFEVQPVELGTITDVKYRYRDDCADVLLASSPMVSLKLPTRKLHKPVTMQIPVPPNPNKKQRPTTAAPEREKGSSSKARPTSAFMASYKKDDEDEDKLSLLSKSAEGNWGVVSTVELTQPKNKDFVVFTMETELIDRVMIMRTKNADCTVQQVEKIANLLEHSIKHRVTQVICRQKNDDSAQCLMQMLPVAKIDRYLKKFEEEGFENGPHISRDIVMREGQEVTLRFRGNIRADDPEQEDHCNGNADEVEAERKFVYNSHVRARIDFSVVEIDPFAQKGIDCYRGFAQLFSRGMVKREVLDENKKRVIKEEEGDVLLAELLISLPKPPAEAPKPINRAPVVMHNQDLVSNDLLRHLATEIGEEWKKLALHLQIRRVRIQAILRNNVNAENAEESIYDMLLTWAKKVPRSVNKVELLGGALMSCGRPDLAEDLKDRDADFRRQRALSARDSNLKRSFVKVAQNARVSGEWKILCRQLGLSESDMMEIESQNTSMRERCYQGLLRWQQIKETASVESLAKQLRRCKYHEVAAQVKHIVS